MATAVFHTELLSLQRELPAVSHWAGHKALSARAGSATLTLAGSTALAPLPFAAAFYYSQRKCCLV